jgi:hypothetical protein
MRPGLTRDLATVLLAPLVLAVVGVLIWGGSWFDAHIEAHLSDVARSGASTGRFTALAAFWVFR